VCLRPPARLPMGPTCWTTEAWRVFFAGSPASHFEVEEMFGAGDRVIVRWLCGWADGHVRGADLLRVRAGRVAESLAYVKG
jgi:hypothetical protein